MRSILKYFILPFAAIMLSAADPSWKDKPILQWDEQDAKQFLVDSPWIKYARLAALPEQNEGQRRDGGVMGGGQNGLGLEVIKELKPFGFGSSAKQDSSIFLPAVPIRWESAAPVRAAEAKIGAPTWNDEGFYAIAVYHMPDLLDEKPRTLAADLKRKALLKADGNKQLKPSQVVILPEARGLAVVIYLFSRAEQITVDDKRMELKAQIGRLAVTQYFNLEEMQLQGKLEL